MDLNLQRLKLKWLIIVNQPPFDTIIILNTLDSDLPSLSYEQSNLFIP